MRTSPPIIFTVSILLGIELEAFVPLPVDWVSPDSTRTVGITIVVFSFVLVGWTFMEFRKARIGFDSYDAVMSLLRTDPFAFSRNPMYLSPAMLQLGLGIWQPNAWIVILLVPTMILANVLAILPEERFLEDQFGESLQDHRGWVIRWL